LAYTYELRARLRPANLPPAEPASPETAEFSEADQKVLEQIRSRFSKGEP
jgi:hypothetical protein